MLPISRGNRLKFIQNEGEATLRESPSFYNLKSFRDTNSFQP